VCPSEYRAENAVAVDSSMAGLLLRDPTLMMKGLLGIMDLNPEGLELASLGLSKRRAGPGAVDQTGNHPGVS
jgi:hypothetical protein